jgi:single-stranded-DNA-specific exonuclease
MRVPCERSHNLTYDGKDRRLAAQAQWLLKRRFSDAFWGHVPGVNPLLAKVLYARGLQTRDQVDAFLATDQPLGDPFDLPDMAAAVARLQRALEQRERIVVYGDFDADGVSATVLLVSALQAVGGDVTPYIPDRFDEAYGLNIPALTHLREAGADLVVTVDCGIRSLAEAAHCRQIGLDLVITDHHTAPAQLPAAVAVVNPKRADSRYPFASLAGVGVAHRLVDALYRALRRSGYSPDHPLDPDVYLDLVALGTVADIVPLIEENRALVHRGLERLCATERPGLAALMEVSGVRSQAVRSEDIAFRLGPRINAAGRLDHAMLAYRLLVAAEPDKARTLAEELNRINAQRQDLLNHQVALAETLLGEPDSLPLLFVAGPEFHEGIVGLVASRLTEAYYRPALVMRATEEGARGSARSIEGLHITQALDQCADLLTRYGGHERAAGLSLEAQHVEPLRQRLEEYCAANLDETLLQPRLRVDAIVDLAEIDGQAVQALATLEPTGEENPPPLLATLNLSLRALRAVGSAGRHLQFHVSDGSRSLRGIGFGLGYLAEELTPGARVDVVYTPALEEYQGNTYLQLVTRAIRLAR